MADTLDLSPELQYELALAALELLAGVSAGVHKRVERAVDSGQLTSNPGVRPADLLALRRVVNKIEPGGLADRTIGIIKEKKPDA